MPASWTVQPPAGTAANDKWIGRGLVALWEPRSARELISGDTATTNTATPVTTAIGEAGDFSGTARQVFAHRAAYAQAGAMTLVVLCDVDTLTGYGQLIAKTGGSGWVYDLRIGVSGTSSEIHLSRGNSAGSGAAVNSGANRVSAGASNVLLSVVAANGAVGGSAGFFVGATKYTGGGAGSGSVADGGGDVWIGRNTVGTTQLDGRIYYIALFSGALSDAYVAELAATRWDVYQPMVTQDVSEPLAVADALSVVAQMVAAQADAAALLDAQAASRVTSVTVAEAMSAGDAAGVASVLAGDLAELLPMADMQAVQRIAVAALGESAAAADDVSTGATTAVAALVEVVVLAAAQDAARSTAADAAEAMTAGDAAAAAGLLAALLGEAGALSDAADGARLAAAQALEAIAAGAVAALGGEYVSAVQAEAAALDGAPSAQADFVAEMLEPAVLRDSVGVLMSALEAVRDLVRQVLPGWKDQFGRWIDDSKTDRYAVIRPAGGPAAGLLRRPAFTVLLIAARGDDETAAYDAGCSLVAATPTAGHIVSLRAGEPVPFPTSDGRAAVEIAITTITT